MFFVVTYTGDLIPVAVAPKLPESYTCQAVLHGVEGKTSDDESGIPEYRRSLKNDPHGHKTIMKFLLEPSTVEQPVSGTGNRVALLDVPLKCLRRNPGCVDIVILMVLHSLILVSADRHVGPKSTRLKPSNDDQSVV